MVKFKDQYGKLVNAIFLREGGIGASFPRQPSSSWGKYFPESHILSLFLSDKLLQTIRRSIPIQLGEREHFFISV